MARFHTPGGGTLPGERWAEDYAAARRFGALRVGELALYYREGLKKVAQPLGEIRSAELGGRSRFAKCGCGCLEVKGGSLDLRGEAGLLCSVFSEDEEELEQALRALREKLPELAEG